MGTKEEDISQMQFAAGMVEGISWGQPELDVMARHSAVQRVLAEIAIQNVALRNLVGNNVDVTGGLSAANDGVSRAGHAIQGVGGASGLGHECQQGTLALGRKIEDTTTKISSAEPLLSEAGDLISRGLSVLRTYLSAMDGAQRDIQEASTTARGLGTRMQEYIVQRMIT